MLKTTLFAAISAATHVVCDNMEIDNFTYLDGTVRLDCGRDTVALLKDQEIEIDENGCVTVKANDHPRAALLGLEPCDVDMSFKVSIPLRAEHLG